MRASNRGPMQALGQLTDRDHTILGWLYDHKIMTTAQIATAQFPSLDSAQDRLLELYQLGLLDRGRMYREGGGKNSWRYMLDYDGWAVVAAFRGDGPPPRRDKVRSRNLHLIQSPKTAHLLGVNGFFAGLAGYARCHEGAALEQWLSEAQIIDSMGPTFTPGPRIRPDGFGVFSEGGRSVAFFYEHDTGTETLQTLVDKVDTYARGRVRTLVLFDLHSYVREQNLHLRLGPSPIVSVATSVRSGADTSGVKGWLTHSTDCRDRKRLVEIPSDLDA